MTRDEFEGMIVAMRREIPAEFFDGVAEVIVSPRIVPHAEREDVFTLGECIRLPLDQDGLDDVQSRVVLYHGSFRALAAFDAEFDWEAEAWETLTHELRHHVEWRARQDALGDADEAAEANFARQDGERHDPCFYLQGEQVAPDLYHVDHDWFLDRLVRHVPDTVSFQWGERSYRVLIPPTTTLPVYLVLEGVADPPLGDLILVLRRRPRLWNLMRPPILQHGVARVILDEQPEVG